MLHQLQAIIDNPENVPQLSPLLREQLQARLNGGHLMTNGTIQWLKSQGFSEQYIFGFIAGMNSVCGLLDDSEFISNNQEEDD